MKNKLILTVLSLLALCACDGTGTSSLTSSNSSSESSNPTSVDSSSNTPETEGWTEEQKKMMQDNLYGEVLPYFDAGKDAYIDFLYGRFTVNGQETIKFTDLASYAALYTEADGWYDSKDQYDNVTEYEYCFQKQVTIDGGKKRFIDVRFYVVGSLFEIAEEGFFALYAYDNHDYEFPTAMFDANIKNYYPESKQHVPVFPADYYITHDSSAMVLCVTSDQNAVESYKTILNNNQFTIQPEMDQYQRYVAISPCNNFSVVFNYIAKKKGLAIALADVPTTETNQA